MKRLLIFIFSTIIYAAGFAQDIIIKRDGSEENVKIVEVSGGHIKYRKWTNQNGPIYNIPTTDIFIIKYMDGRKEVFQQNNDDNINDNINVEIPDFSHEKEKQMIRDDRLYLGIIGGPQFSLLNIEAEDSFYGNRTMFLIGATLDWYISKYKHKNWFLHTSMIYSLEGGKGSSIDDNLTNLNLDYLNLNFGIGVRRRIIYWKLYTGIGINTNAKATIYGNKENVYSDVFPITYTLGSDFGFCIKNNWSIGFSYDFRITSIMKESFYNNPESSFSFSYSFKLAYRFALNKQNKINKR